MVATDDDRIAKAVESFSGEFCMTDPNHPSGTDRIAEVARQIPGDIFVNVQGDEPEIKAEVIDQLAGLLEEDPQADMATLAYPISAEEVDNPNIVKVVFDRNGYALYFSRARIPFVRDETLPSFSRSFWGHMGIYAYRRSFLEIYTSLPTSSLEEIERLEQLRALENGYRIRVGKTDKRGIGIDTPEDYRKFVEQFYART